MKRLLAVLLIGCVAIGCASVYETLSDAGATNRLKKQIDLAVLVINSFIADAKVFASRDDIEDIIAFQEKFAFVAESIQTKVDLIMAMYVPMHNEEVALHALEATKAVKAEMARFTLAAELSTLEAMRGILNVYDSHPLVPSDPGGVLEVIEVPDEE